MQEAPLYSNSRSCCFFIQEEGPAKKTALVLGALTIGACIATGFTPNIWFIRAPMILLDIGLGAATGFVGFRGFFANRDNCDEVFSNCCSC